MECPKVIKFRVRTVLDLIKINIRAILGEAAYFHYMNGRLFSLGGAGDSIVVFYTDVEKKGNYIKFNLSTNEWEWVDKMDKPTPLVKYIPIVMVESTNLDLF
ncbi:hypothetical protein DRN86_01175 [Candidatus Geothermarchaeota archaeon]|nr:MAG: hypothetical protein DRN86_01175 [Candidatus Geothermarchaeota archaeon]